MESHNFERVDGRRADCVDCGTWVSALAAYWRTRVTHPPLCSYGNPFLLKLGLSEQLTSLVWLAGPISGLIAQPLIGAFAVLVKRHWLGMIQCSS